MRGRVALLFAILLVTALGSYAYFHIDENFQILQWTWWKLGLVDEWTLPMEYALRMRSWFQPFLYWLIAQAIPSRDEFVLAFVFRFATGLACLGALLLFVKTLPKALPRETVLLFGFLPYLCVRTSSETLSMAAFTAAYALALRKRFWLAGVLLGAAFEARFQSAFLGLGLVAWLVVVERERTIWKLVPGGLGVMAATAFVDHWGYGVWCFPAWNYFHTNIVEGIAALFGSDPPFAYLWMSPANIFLPIVVLLMVAAVFTWVRHPRHPVTWTTLPFVLLHNLLSHKEERFLFPIAIFALAFVPLGFGEGPARWQGAAAKLRRIADSKVLATWSVVLGGFLAVWPLGWHHHVRFQMYVHHTFGNELHAAALPDFDLGLPAFHPRVYDVEKASADKILKDLDQGPRLLIADSPKLDSGNAALDARAHRIWTELPSDSLAPIFDRYNALARPPLKPLRFRTLYRLE